MTRERILDAAVEAIRTGGYADLQIAEIARIAGLRPGSIYYHFASRDRIVEEVVLVGFDRVIRAVEAGIEALPTGSSWRARIERAIACHIEMLVGQSVYSTAIMKLGATLPPAVVEKVLVRQRAYNATWSALLAGAQADGEIRPDVDLSALRMLLLGALNWVVEWYRADRYSVEEVAALAGRMVFDGVGRSR